MLTVNRFAPSPTGALHFGSLVAATASYLTARHANGRWLLRIEDLDKPREQAGAADAIIQTLLAFGFEWDGCILYQSQRFAAYEAALSTLSPYVYACRCSRKQLQAQGYLNEFGWVYPNTCCTQHYSWEHSAIRIQVPAYTFAFEDQIQGHYQQQLAEDIGDFVLKRADGIYAYQLAVVVDDAFQGVNQIVRGADLLDNTPRQLYLQQQLGYPTPQYAHIPLALDSTTKQKLSKQNLAPALHTTAALTLLVNALRFLGQPCPNADDFENLTVCWDWAILNWDIDRVPKTTQCILPPPPKWNRSSA